MKHWKFTAIHKKYNTQKICARFLYNISLDSELVLIRYNDLFDLFFIIY